MDNVLWKLCHSLPHNSSEDNFWSSLGIWNRSPNLIKKRIFGVNLFDLDQHNDLNYINKIVKELSSKEFNSEDATRYLDKESKGIIRKMEIDSGQNFRYQAFAKIILYKRNELNSLEMCIFDMTEKLAIFFEPNTSQSFYAIQFKENSIELKIPSDSKPNKDLGWYSHVLLPKLIKWMQNHLGGHCASISLVSIDHYKSLYNILKKKYSSDIMQIWTEVTDPDKFIHEDIAIATYLLLLWKDKPQTFVDLGCGNGLLVHILNGESHLGVGYDLRARKIWDKYPQTTVLKEMQIKPSKEQTFPEADWIIGNHSDELTPWIPVISLLSSPNTNFFLLPCCAYEFDGSKFCRNNSSKSLYNDYLDYVEKICETCGFNTSRDRLRIPSTKRICFVSSGRNYNDLNSVKKSVDSLIENSSNSTNNKIDEQNINWNIKIKLRDSKEKVLNCTQLNSKLKLNIISIIAEILLKDSHITNSWNEGTPTKIDTIVQSLPKEVKIQLKSQGKGIQTFIKNHHHVFKLESGIVSFRKPLETKVRSDNWKTKQCWFYENHPNLCPLEDDKCSYQHLKT